MFYTFFLFIHKKLGSIEESYTDKAAVRLLKHPVHTFSNF